ncbi:MAG TPA: D-alanyl-D-alanine carboxypeptidase/D-alanyl-D-alanine-endopeptidase [Leptolyngbyaceae cyanobacterium]
MALLKLLFKGVRLTQGLKVGVMGAALAIAPVLAAQAKICPAQLAGRLDAITAQPILQKARVGVLIETQGETPTERQVLYARDADQFFIPASNAKLLTTAAALDFLGPTYRIRTSVYATSQSNGLTSLRVVGRGDPSLETEDLLALAQQVSQSGLRSVSQLVTDDSYFPGSIVNPNWEWEDVQAGYGAPANGLILNGNAINLSLAPQAVGQPLQVIWENSRQSNAWRIVNQSRTVAPGEAELVNVGRDLSQPVLYVSGQLVAGSEAEAVAIAVPNPAQAFLDQFQQTLNNQGISVAQTAIDVDGLSQLPNELAFHQSPPLSELLMPTNRNSNNLYAEALLKTVGVTYFPQRPDQATEAGIKAVTNILVHLGLDANSFSLADGSGLSRHNLVTPSALVELLQIMATHPDANIYRESLAVAGVSGTLRNRLRNTVLNGQLYGKSGAVSGNVALSGYVNVPNYRPLVVSILINNSDQRAGTLRQVIDQMVLTLAEVQSCP